MTDDRDARDLYDDVRDLIERDDWDALRSFAIELHPADLSQVTRLLEPVERERLFADLPSDVVGNLLEFVDEDDLRATVATIAPEDLPAVLQDVADDVVADVIRQLEPEGQASALAALDLDQAEGVEELLRFSEDSAGSIMTREYVAFDSALTVQEAIDQLRVLRPPSDHVYYLYVTDGDGRLMGTLSIRDVLVSPPATHLEDITRREILQVTTSTDREEVARQLKRYNLLAVPVVDDSEFLQGVITVDDLIDVLEDEATEDMFRMVGIGEDERISSPVVDSVRRRLPWLALNLLTAFLAGATVSLFDSTIARAAVLAAFMPIVAGQGGNAGTQTATIAVRSLALGDLGTGSVLRVCRKEILVGTANGIVIGLLAGIVALVWEQNLALAVVLAAALALTVAGATVGGLLIPLGLRAVNVDPALSANVFVTTLTDILGFVVFLGIATVAIEQIA